MRLLGMGGTTESLAQEKLDGGDTGADIRDLDLRAVLLSAVGAGESGPVFSGGSEGRVEQRLLDLIQGSCSSLCERGTHVCGAQHDAAVRGRGLRRGHDRNLRLRASRLRVVAGTVIGAHHAAARRLVRVRARSARLPEV
jgi:hypothetical protein